MVIVHTVLPWLHVLPFCCLRSHSHLANQGQAQVGALVRHGANLQGEHEGQARG